ncbi:golgin subfamily A member 6-like protein 6 [Chaetodon trifascialis]|uniref:golgin subfamily A member 6-like protein 6 n=1 Tax=Chaetodon trifascialis TaxID=109706 RepID=UPI003993B7E7
MAREIHAKELMLQKKLCRVEEKIRQRIQEDSVDTTAGDDKECEERPNRGQAERGKTQTKTRLSEWQRSESVRSGEIMQEIRQEDVKQLRKKQDQRNEHRMRNIHEEERARWKGRKIKVAQGHQLQRKGCNGTHEVIVHGQEVSGDLNKSRWKNVKEHTRRKGEGEKDNGMWRETDVKAKEREQNTTSVGKKDWTREKKFKERTYKEMCSANNERDMPQRSQQKTSHRAATENHTGAGKKQSVEPLLPPVSSSSHSSRPEQGEDSPIGNTYDDLQPLPCRICNRKFVSKRLEVHVQICAKAKQSHQVFNSYAKRIKGTQLEEYLKNHSRLKTTEVGQ